MDLHFFNKEFAALSVRAQNTIGQPGGIEDALSHYADYGRFTMFRSVGPAINKEVCDFCEFVINAGGAESMHHQNDHIFKHIFQYTSIYESQKAKLSISSKKALARIEKDNKYYKNIENKIHFLNKCFFYQPGYFRKFRGMAKWELEALQQTMLAAKERYQPDSNAAWQQLKFEYFDREVYKNSMNPFHIYFNDEEKKQLFQDGKYSFKKLFCIFLMEEKKGKHFYDEIFANRFFSPMPVPVSSLAKILLRSKTRIRQIDEYLYKQVIPQVSDNVMRLFTGKAYDLPGNTPDVFYPENFEAFTFRDIHYTPNSNLSEKVYGYVYRNTHSSIRDIIGKSYKNFIASSGYFFVSAKFIERLTLNNLLRWMDEKLKKAKNLEEASVYGTIEQFYNECNIHATEAELQVLYDLIVKVVKK